MRTRLLAMLAIALAGCEREAPAAPEATRAATPEAAPSDAAPDAAACTFPDALDDSERMRLKPLPVPAALRGIVGSSKDVFAVRTLSGGVHCVDTRWMESTEPFELSEDERFLSFDWSGYESFGHMIVDRSGKGQAFDTGAAPRPSPSGKRLASVEWSESGYGALQGVAVWEIGRTGVRELGKAEDLPFLFQWQVDRWVGENCVDISAVPAEDMPEDGWQKDPAKRRQFAFRPGAAGWALETGACRSK